MILRLIYSFRKQAANISINVFRTKEIFQKVFFEGKESQKQLEAFIVNNIALVDDYCSCDEIICICYPINLFLHPSYETAHLK
jgi:hypothetical protein